MNDWFDEKLYVEADSPGYRQSFRIEKVLYEGRTDFQDVTILETKYFGRILVLDGVIQTTECDEFVYHEMLVHQPMIAHGAVKRVLIIGGGDGGVLREVLRHSVEAVTMVEIDGQVVDLCREYLPSLSAGAFDDPRANLEIGDGFGFVEETDQSFDVIIVDSTDPFGPGEILFSDAFYAHCKRVLTPGGIMVTQNGVPFFQGDEVATTAKRLRPHFQDVAFYGAVVPTYVGGFMTLAWASDDTSLRHKSLETIQERAHAAEITGRYWSPEMHQSAFTLPPFVTALYSDRD